MRMLGQIALCHVMSSHIVSSHLISSHLRSPQRKVKVPPGCRFKSRFSEKKEKESKADGSVARRPFKRQARAHVLSSRLLRKTLARVSIYQCFSCSRARRAFALSAILSAALSAIAFEPKKSSPEPSFLASSPIGNLPTFC